MNDDGSEWDCPQYHAILWRPDVRKVIGNRVRYKLARKGLLPHVARAFNIAEG